DLVGPRPADDVEYTAGWERQHELDWPVWIRIRRREARYCRQGGRARREMKKSTPRNFHDASSRRPGANPAYSSLTPANFTTLAHFSVSSVMYRPNCACDSGIGTKPRPTSR